MSLDALQDLFLDELKDLYDAEKQLVKALPKLAKATSSAVLQDAFQSHLQETKGQVARLEQVFKEVQAAARGKKCKAMEGLIEEGSDLMEEDSEPAVLDAGLICAAQKVEHYEIAAYGTLCTWAKQLGLKQSASLLGATLIEEKAADKKLSGLASKINFEADGEDDE